MTNGHRPPALARIDRAIVLSALAGTTAAAWLFLVSGHAGGAVGVGRWPFLTACTMWMVMMVAMMLPPVLPWILLFASTRRDRDTGQPFGQTTIFVFGYFTVWAAFCVGAAGLQLMLRELAWMSAGADRVDERVAGVLFLAAGVYQLTPLKAACLRHCRSPLGYFLSRWQDGPAGAFRMGATHGLVCLGCCWALMLLSFALGVMNLLWMAALTAVLCIEKIAPGGRRAGQAIGVACVIAGAWYVGAG